MGGVSTEMAKRKPRIRQSEIVSLFASRLRQLRQSRGMTQAELARRAHVTTSYIWRLESGGAAPGIDLVDRLAQALGTTAMDLLPATASANTLPVLKEQATRLFGTVLSTANRETLEMLNPLLACVAEALARRN
jgi:transcriptional regulator with XRE-family HTH domain